MYSLTPVGITRVELCSWSTDSQDILLRRPLDPSIEAFLEILRRSVFSLERFYRRIGSGAKWKVFGTLRMMCLERSCDSVKRPLRRGEGGVLYSI